MPKRYKLFIFSSLALLLALVGIFSATFAFAKGQSPVNAYANQAPSAKPAIAHMVAIHTVNMQHVPAATATASHSQVRTLPFLTGVNQAVYAQRKAAAAHSTHAPVDTHAISDVNTPTTTAKFNGMADSASICGCQPPDQALATSSSWVFQGVNTSFAVYSPSGALQSGWPKNAQNFFGVPNPGSCDTRGPFLSDPRAFYDPKDGRFWAASLQVEGAFGLNSCPEQTIYWIAVSKTNNPNGVWNVYAFNMALSSSSCPTCAADYTQFGFDQTAIYFTGNMFTQDGNTYAYAESFSVLKSTMEAGSAATAYGLYKFSANNVFLDTVQPVENEASSGPGVGLLINSFNMNGDGTHDCFTTACSGLVVWAIANPGQPTISATGVIVSSKTYINPPAADEPGHPASIETLDTRISGTPVYQQGLISFALETGLKNTTQVAPAIYWGQVQPTISGGIIMGGSIFQDGYIHFSGDRAASFGALMATSTGNLLIVFDTMSSTIDPGIMYATRLTTTTKGTFTAAIFLKKSTTATNNSRWGDYEAASYDGSNTWFSSQYSGSNGDWATFVGKVLL
jgi:hypothetical protein